MAAALISRDEPGARVPPSWAAAVVVAVGLAVAVAHRSVQVFEAWMSAGLASTLGVVPAESFGSAVVFPLDGRYVGFTITPGCSVAFLLPFFFVVAAALVASGRLRPGRAVTTVLAVSATLFAVNQVRLLIVSGSMRGWGFETGYERSHILLGTMASTLGVIVGVLLFLYFVTRPAKADGARG